MLNGKRSTLAQQLMLGVLVLHSALVSAAEDPPTTSADILDAVFARSEAIQTGTIRFVCIHRWETKGEAQPFVLPEGFPGKLRESPPSGESEESVRTVTFAGTEWVQQFLGSNGRRLNRNDFSMTYTEGVNFDESPLRNLLIKTPEGPLDHGHTVELWKLVLRCGTIPLPPMDRWIRDHRQEAKVAGRRMVGLYNCDVLEWEVGIREFHKAFYYSPENFDGEQSAILRLLVAGELGNAVVKVEYSTVDGDVSFWFEGEDFREVAPSIFFPFIWTRRYEKKSGTTSFEIKTASFEGVNQPLPNDAFAISIPQGTRVRDKRPGRESVFRVGETRTIRDVDEIIQAAREYGREQIAVQSERSPTRKVLLWLNGAVLAAIVAIWGVRRWSTSR